MTYLFGWSDFNREIKLDNRVFQVYYVFFCLAVELLELLLELNAVKQGVSFRLTSLRTRIRIQLCASIGELLDTLRTAVFIFRLLALVATFHWDAHIGGHLVQLLGDFIGR